MGKFIAPYDGLYQELGDALPGGVCAAPCRLTSTAPSTAGRPARYSIPLPKRRLGTRSSQTPGRVHLPGATPGVSASGTANGIVWAAESTVPAVCTPTQPPTSPHRVLQQQPGAGRPRPIRERQQVHRADHRQRPCLCRHNQRRGRLRPAGYGDVDPPASLARRPFREPLQRRRRRQWGHAGRRRRGEPGQSPRSGWTLSHQSSPTNCRPGALKRNSGSTYATLTVNRAAQAPTSHTLSRSQAICALGLLRSAKHRYSRTQLPNLRCVTLRRSGLRPASCAWWFQILNLTSFHLRRQLVADLPALLRPVKSAAESGDDSSLAASTTDQCVVTNSDGASADFAQCDTRFSRPD